MNGFILIVAAWLSVPGGGGYNVTTQAFLNKEACEQALSVVHQLTVDGRNQVKAICLPQ